MPSAKIAIRRLEFIYLFIYMKDMEILLGSYPFHVFKIVLN